MSAANGLKLSNPATVLAVTPAAYVVCDPLLTPPPGLETRPVSYVTGLGFVVLGLLFVGLALAIVSLVLLFRRSARAPIIAIVAAVLYFPAVRTEQTGHFLERARAGRDRNGRADSNCRRARCDRLGLFTLRRGNAATKA